MVHVSEIAWTLVEDPSDILQLGDAITVVVTDLDRSGSGWFCSGRRPYELRTSRRSFGVLAFRLDLPTGRDEPRTFVRGQKSVVCEPAPPRRDEGLKPVQRQRCSFVEFTEWEAGASLVGRSAARLPAFQCSARMRPSRL
ncbi:S1 RNA-binding domain-containing protein [Streptomyces sp. NPDC006670]|uniref:S1 RNA-binding domain-containing protein n=1 Tax=Streptomyces sp. NPDC006670 TaxID=3154476 RepID=UPI0033F0362F